MTFAAEDATKTIDLTDISVAVFTQAIQNAATLRADNAASMSRLRFASQDLALQKTNMEAASGRITDVDIAAESTRLAKYNALVQASASMLAQANMNSAWPSCFSGRTPMRIRTNRFRTRGDRPPTSKVDGAADKEVRGINTHTSRRIQPCQSQ